MPFEIFVGLLYALLAVCAAIELWPTREPEPVPVSEPPKPPEPETDLARGRRLRKATPEQAAARRGEVIAVFLNRPPSLNGGDPSRNGHGP